MAIFWYGKHVQDEKYNSQLLLLLCLEKRNGESESVGWVEEWEKVFHSLEPEPCIDGNIFALRFEIQSHQPELLHESQKKRSLRIHEEIVTWTFRINNGRKCIESILFESFSISEARYEREEEVIDFDYLFNPFEGFLED